MARSRMRAFIGFSPGGRGMAGYGNIIRPVREPDDHTAAAWGQSERDSGSNQPPLLSVLLRVLHRLHCLFVVSSGEPEEPPSKCFVVGFVRK